MAGTIHDSFEEYVDRAEARLDDHGVHLSTDASAALRQRVEAGIRAATARGLSAPDLTESLDLLLERFAGAVRRRGEDAIDLRQFSKTWNAVCVDLWCGGRWRLRRRW